jgi:hypothetical protein
MTFNFENYARMREWANLEEIVKEAWKDGFDEGCKSLTFRLGDEVLDKTTLDYGVVVSDEDCPWVRVLYACGCVPAYEREEANTFIEKTGNVYSEITILREKLKYSNGREF